MKFPVFSQMKMSDAYKRVMQIAKKHNKEHDNDKNIMYCPYCGKPLVKVEGRMEPLETLIEHVSGETPSYKHVYKCPDKACIGRYAMWSFYGSMYIDFPEEIIKDKDAFNKLYKFVHLKDHFLGYNANAINSFDYRFDLEHPIGSRDNMYYMKWVEKLCEFLHLNTIVLPVITAQYKYNTWGKRTSVSYKLEYYIRDQECAGGYTYAVHQSLWRQFKSNMLCADWDYRKYKESKTDKEKDKLLRSLYGYREFDGAKLTGFINNITYNFIIPIKYGLFKGVKQPQN